MAFLSPPAGGMRVDATTAGLSGDAASAGGALAAWHYVIFALALVSTVAAYSFSSRQSTLRAEEHFTREVSQITEMIRDRMSTYEDALRAGVAAINLADRPIDNADWQRFERSLDLSNRYPGINGIGVILHVAESALAAFVDLQRRDRPDFTVHPPVDSAYHLPITFIEPADINRAAIGLDMAFEASRLRALRAAGTLQMTQMTAPIVLVQDERSTPGFLIFAPLIGAAEPDSDAVPGFTGAVYAPIIMERLMEGTIGQENRSVLIRIGDAGSILYSEMDADAALVDPDPLFRETVRIPLYGRIWTIDVETTSMFRTLNGTAAPTLVLGFGLLVEASLLLLFVGLRRANVRAVWLADQLTQELRIEKRELEVSNIALERYNYLSSHDLKTPLRGMHDVTLELRDDLQDHFPDAASDRSLIRHLEDLTMLVGEIDTLIGGMVAFSQIGRTKDNRSFVSVRPEVEAIVAAQGPLADRIELRGIFPEVYCSRELVQLIFGHLIGNALDHHPTPASCRVTVSATALGENLVIRVTDDGQGIPKQWQSQLFDRMRKVDDTGLRGPKTGLGLAMVKRAALCIGGYVTLTSEPGKGSSFTVMLVDVVRDRAATPNRAASEPGRSPGPVNRDRRQSAA